MKIKTRSLTLTAPDADAVCQSQTAASAGALTLDGVSANQNFDIARRVAITSDADDSGNTFTLTGIARDGQTVISETITGPDTTSVVSVFDYLTVTSVIISGASSGNITVGTNQKASSDWVPLCYHTAPFLVSLITSLSSGASLNYTVEFTDIPILDPPNSTRYTVPSTRIRPHNDTNLVSQTSAKEGNFAFPIPAVRISTNSYSSGTVMLEVIQAGV
jgi:hypothetical protein